MQDKIIIIYYTERASKLAAKLRERLSKTGSISLHDGRKSRTEDYISRYFRIYQHIIFISSSGIAVRCIAPCLKTKYLDPSVTVVSDDGRFTIPLIGSHLMGGIVMAEKVSRILENSLVTTTATDNMGITTPDTLAYKEDWKIINPKLLRRTNSLLIQGKSLSEDLYEEADAYIIKRKCYKDIEKYIKEFGEKKQNMERADRALMIVENPVCLGIGCRRGKSMDAIESFAQEVLEKQGLSLEDVKYISSSEAKIDEVGIIKLSEKLKAKLLIFENEDIEKVQDRFEKSDFVKDNVGVYNVSASSAYLTYNNIIKEKERRDGITISISRKL